MVIGIHTFSLYKYHCAHLVESVSSILRDSQRPESSVSVKTVEKVDALLALEPRTAGRPMSEKYVKQSRRPLLSAKKMGLKEGRMGERGGEGEGVGEGRGWSGDGVGLGMGLGWEASALSLPGSGVAGSKGASSSRSLRDGRLSLLSGVIPGRVEEPDSRDSPLSRGSDDEDDLEGQSDDSDSSCGTVVSLSTSLPIVFSGLHQQTPKPSPLATTNTGVSGPGTITPAADEEEEDDLLVGSEQPIAKAMPVPSAGLGERIISTVKKTSQVVGMKGMYMYMYKVCTHVRTYTCICS